MGRLIADFLRLSRVGRGKLSIERLDLGELARAPPDDLAAQEPARRVEWDIQPGLEAERDTRNCSPSRSTTSSGTPGSSPRAPLAP